MAFSLWSWAGSENTMGPSFLRSIVPSAATTSRPKASTISCQAG
jgi:hypothetical protein